MKKKIFIYILICITIFNSIMFSDTVYAEHAAESYAIPVPQTNKGVKPIKHYVRPKKIKSTGTVPPTTNYTTIHTGWRAYLCKEDGTVNSTVVDLLFSVDLMDDIDGRFFSTRVGNAETSLWMPVIKGMPKPDSSNPAAWFKNKQSDGKTGAEQLIHYCWGADGWNKFKDTSEMQYLCLEPVIWHKFSTEPEWKDFILYASGYEWLQILNDCGIDINSYVYRTKHGKTIPIKSTFGDKSWLGLNAVDQDVNKVIGGHFLSIGDIDAGNFAYAIMAYRNLDFAHQSTCNEEPTDLADDAEPGPGGPPPEQPHVAPEESKGKWKIHKTYRTIHYKGGVIVSETNDGQFLDPDCTNVISVEDEEEYNGYKLVA